MNDKQAAGMLGFIAASDKAKDKEKQELEAYRKSLQKIRDTCGQVCPEYEICLHDSCESSYAAWAIADEVLKKYE